jgi:hypothetical protein
MQLPATLFGSLFGAHLDVTVMRVGDDGEIEARYSATVLVWDRHTDGELESLHAGWHGQPISWSGRGPARCAHTG